MHIPASARRTCLAGACPPRGFAASPGRPSLAHLSHCRVATQGSGPYMRLSSCVPRRVPPARAVGAICAVLLLRGRTSFSLPALLRAVERIFACPVRFRGRAARPRNRLYTAGTTAGLYTADPGNARYTQCLGCQLTGQSQVAQSALVTLDSPFAFARPAPLRVRPAPLCVACLLFGIGDADLPNSRCRGCRQSVEPANTSLLTARRLRPAGLRPASRRLSRRSSTQERTPARQRWPPPPTPRQSPPGAGHGVGLVTGHGAAAGVRVTQDPPGRPV